MDLLCSHSGTLLLFRHNTPLIIYVNHLSRLKYSVVSSIKDKDSLLMLSYILKDDVAYCTKIHPYYVRVNLPAQY